MGATEIENTILAVGDHTDKGVITERRFLRFEERWAYYVSEYEWYYRNELKLINTIKHEK